MKKVVTALFLTIICISSLWAIDPGELESVIDEYLNPKLTELEIPGFIVTVIEGNTVLMNKGYGYKNLESKIPIDPDTTLFPVGSTTKIFTYTAVMQLVEQGLLDLDENLEKYIDFKLNNPYENPVRVIDLMNHRGGFENSIYAMMARTSDDALSIEILSKNFQPKIIRKPGTVSA